MVFKPKPYMTLFAVPALALLITLGVWQLQRMAWKQDLVDQYAASSAQPAVSLSTAACGGGDFRRRPVEPPATNDREPFRVFGYDAAGNPGWRLLRPAPAPSCLRPAELILVQTGFEHLQSGVIDPAPERYRLALMRPAGPLAAENNPDGNEWFVLDAEEFAAALSRAPGSVSEIWARPDAPPASLTQTPPARHFGYALTWFGLALTLIGVYFAYHAKEGRFRLRK